VLHGIVNNAGYSESAAMELVSHDALVKQFDGELSRCIIVFKEVCLPGD